MKAEITDLQVLAELNRQGVSKDDVTLQRDYCAKYPSTQVYKVKNSRKRIAVLSSTPMVTNDGEMISLKWLVDGSKYVADKNLFAAVVDGNSAGITRDNKSATWSPQIFLNGKEQLSIGQWFLTNDESVIEMGYGICRRQLILRNIGLLEYYIFDKDPKGDVRIKSNLSGDLKASGYWAVDGNKKPLKGFVVKGDEKIIPSKVFEGAAYPVIVDDTFTSHSDDGYLKKADADYETAHDAGNATTLFLSGDRLEVGQEYDGDEYYIRRAALFFDTSSLPDDAEITEVVLSLYFTFAGDPTNSDYVVVLFTGNQPLQVSDYHTGNFASNFGSIDSDDVVENAYNNITINDSIAYINKTGTTKLGLRSSRDIDSIEPGEDDEAYADISSSESGASTEPKLIITYPVGISRPLVNGSPVNTGLVNGVLVR